jgi:hypothetical protein
VLVIEQVSAGTAETRFKVDAAASALDQMTQAIGDATAASEEVGQVRSSTLLVSAFPNAPDSFDLFLTRSLPRRNCPVLGEPLAADTRALGEPLADQAQALTVSLWPNGRKNGAGPD